MSIAPAAMIKRTVRKTQVAKLKKILKNAPILAKQLDFSNEEDKPFDPPKN